MTDLLHASTGTRVSSRATVAPPGARWADPGRDTTPCHPVTCSSPCVVCVAASGNQVTGLRVGRGKDFSRDAELSGRPRQRLNVFSVASSRPNATRP